MKTLKAVILLGCVAAAGLTLGACREEEQDRVLMFHKGAYSGKPDTRISEEARREQRARMRYQGALSGVDRQGGGGGAAPPDVRPPAGATGAAPPALPPELLRQRGEGQRFN